MSGHSKWNNIKNTKAKMDAQRSNVFTKIGREIAVAVKSGGPNPESNNKLADVIAKARSCNMPNDTIARSIKKASGEGASQNYDEIVYEGYGPGGSAIIVQCLTDNKNRTAGDVRHLFDKYGAGLGTSNSVAYMFSIKGVFVLDKEVVKLSEDELLDIVLDIGASDMKNFDDQYIVFSEKENFHEIKNALENKGIQIASSSIDYVANNTMDLPEEFNDKFETLIDGLEALDDVQNVYHNCN